MKVRRVDVFTASLRLDGGFAHFAGRVTALEEVFVRLTGDDGLVGWGEVRGNMAYFSGESPAGIVAALRDVLVPLVVGRSLRERGTVLEAFDRAVAGNARRQGGPRHRLARPRGAARPASPLVPLARRPPGGAAPGSECVLLRAGRRAAAEARRYVAAGVPHRQGPGRPRAVRASTSSGSAPSARRSGDDVRLAVDANQAWTLEGGDPADPDTLERFGIDSVEQPVAAGDVTGLAEVRGRRHPAHGRREPLLAGERDDARSGSARWACSTSSW